MKDFAEIAPVPFGWTRGLVSLRARTIMSDLFPAAGTAEAGECVGIVKRLVAFGRRSLSCRPADSMLVMGYDGRPVCLSAKEIGTEGRSELQRLEALVCRPGSLAFGAMVPHVIHLHEADAPPRQLELILGRKVHLLRSVDWQSDIAVRLSDREPLSRAFEANLRLLTEHPGSMGAVDDQIEQLRAEAMQVLKLFDFDFPMLPAIASLAA